MGNTGDCLFVLQQALDVNPTTKLLKKKPDYAALWYQTGHDYNKDSLRAKLHPDTKSEQEKLAKKSKKSSIIKYFDKVSPTYASRIQCTQSNGNRDVSIAVYWDPDSWGRLEKSGKEGLLL